MSKQKDKNLLSVRSRQKAENETFCSSRFQYLVAQTDLESVNSSVSMYLLKMLKNEAELVCSLQILLQPVALRGLGSRHGHGENKDFEKISDLDNFWQNLGQNQIQIFLAESETKLNLDNFGRIWDKSRFRSF